MNVKKFRRYRDLGLTKAVSKLLEGSCRTPAEGLRVSVHFGWFAVEQLEKDGESSTRLGIFPREQDAEEAVAFLQGRRPVPCPPSPPRSPAPGPRPRP